MMIFLYDGRSRRYSAEEAATGTMIRYIRNGVPLIKDEFLASAADSNKAMRDNLRARHLRADALRNIDTLLQTAKAVFATSGVDVPMRKIAERAGVGVGTIYRHFPQRADLVAAVFRHEVDACAEAAALLAAEHGPGEALDRWMQRYVDFIVAKRGLAAALHSGAAAFETLPAYFDKRLEPALQGLLDGAIAAGELQSDANPRDLLRAVASLCMPSGDGDPAPARRLVGLLIDGLRYRAKPT